jgi:hypothetical protein
MSGEPIHIDEGGWGEDDAALLRRLIDEDVDSGNYTFETSTNGAQASPSIAAAAEPFLGRSHADVLELDFGDTPPDLVEGLVPKGVVISTAGLPETYKGWVCAKKADIIARGTGELFGCKAVASGPVGYFWQDDSERNEAERVQLYAQVHETPRDLQIRWFLNEDLELPRDLARLRATIEHHGFVYVVLDSFYNIAGSADLKDRDAGAIFAALKTQVCDPTGCTVDVVDHMPWATDTNRKRLRGYGDVFKNAAIRAGLYIDADGSKLYVEARGNNIRGFKRTPAYWDADALELRLAEPSETGAEEYEQRVLNYLAEHPWATTDELDAGVEGQAQRVRGARKRLLEAGRVCRAPSPDLGRPGQAMRWNINNQAPSSPVPLFGTPPDAPHPEATEDPPPRPGCPHPVGGTGLARTPLDNAEIERLEAKHGDLLA